MQKKKRSKILKNLKRKMFLLLMIIQMINLKNKQINQSHIVTIRKTSLDKKIFIYIEE